MSKARPNIMLLIAEDTGRHQGCYGDPMRMTPRLDQLAAQGCRYDHAISTAPVCAPSRASIVTGMYSWSLGTHHMRSTVLQPPRLFTHELRDAGYHVNWSTKTDFNFEPPSDFADDTSPWLEDLRHGRLPDKPFFLFRNFPVTHESTMWDVDPDVDWSAAKERLAELERRPGLPRADRAAVPVPPYLPDTPEVRENIGRYYDALAVQDAQVGEVLDALDASPYAHNTIVIYASDHGRGLVREKRWCYDAGIRMPLIVRAPGSVEPDTTSNQLINWVDLAPTMLSLAGVNIPSHYQGVAFLGENGHGQRQYAFAGRDRMDEAFDRVRVCRDQQFHYIRNYWPAIPYAQRNHYMERQTTTRIVRDLHAQGRLTPEAALWMSPTKPEEELYDITRDPHMVRNLADDPAHADTLQRLREALEQHLLEVGDHGAVPESELIARGLVADRLPEYRARIVPLPQAHRIGPPTTLLTSEEAAANTPKPT